MTLSLTNYASLLPSYIKGIIEAYSTITDPLVISGFMKSSNVEWVPYELDGGVSCNRMPLFDGEEVTDPTKFNRVDFAANRLEEVTMSSVWYRTSLGGQATFGALDDPRRMARIINMANPSLSDMTYLTNVIQGHARAAYWNYLESFAGLIYRDCTLKRDYDNTTGPAGNTLTFDTDVKYVPYKLVTDLTDSTVEIVDRANALMNELHILVSPMMKYIQGQPIFFILNRTTFWAFRNILETYKYFQNHRRYEDTEVGGSFQYENSACFSTGDFVFIGMPDNKFPTKTVDAENAYRCLVITPDAVRVKISQGDLRNGIGIYDTTLQSLNVGNAYDYVKNNFVDQTFSKIQSYMGIEPNISSFMQNGALGGNTVPNLLKMYTNVLPSGTDPNAEYIYTRAQYNIGVLRANPYALREFQVKPSLII